MARGGKSGTPAAAGGGRRVVVVKGGNGGGAGQKKPLTLSERFAKLDKKKAAPGGAPKPGTAKRQQQSVQRTADKRFAKVRFPIIEGACTLWVHFAQLCFSLPRRTLLCLPTSPCDSCACGRCRFSLSSRTPDWSWLCFPVGDGQAHWRHACGAKEACSSCRCRCSEGRRRQEAEAEGVARWQGQRKGQQGAKDARGGEAEQGGAGY